MLPRWVTACLLVHVVCAQQTVTIGLMHFQNVSNRNQKFVGYWSSASAVDIAMDRVTEEHLADGINVKFLTVYDSCVEPDAAGFAVDLMIEKNVTCIIGPTCNDAAIAVSVLGAYYNIPVFSWGLATTSQLADSSRYPTAISLAPNSAAVARAVFKTMEFFGWKEFAFLTTASASKCPFIKNDLELYASTVNYTTMSIQLVMVDDDSIEYITQMMLQLKYRTRVIVLCPRTLATVRRNYMLAAFDAGMVTDEYVFVFSSAASVSYEDTMADGSIVNVWEDTSDNPDGRDADAQAAFQRTFVIMTTAVDAESQAEFNADVMSRMNAPPYNCGTTCDNLKVAEFANQLHDATYLYFRSLNRTLEAEPSAFKNGTAIKMRTADRFEGKSGTVVIDSKGNRCPTMRLAGLDPGQKRYYVSEISICGNDVNFTAFVTDESYIWRAYEGKRPKSMPECGFTGTNCPPDFVRDYLWVLLLGIFIIGSAFLIALLAGVYSYRQKQAEQERLNLLWQIPTNSLAKISSKNKGKESQRSLQSTHTTSTKITMESRTETARYNFYTYIRELVAAEKHASRPILSQQDNVFLRKMREVENDNVNRFIGMCIDGPIYQSIWRYCSRGSIKDVMSKTSINMDGFFIFCLIRDIVNGLLYIHSSFLGCHGYLTSSCCLINDRWQVKISAYGIPFVRELEKRSENMQLYTAPEILRDGLNMTGTKEGDIYSLAILVSEMIARTSAWNLENRKEEADEIIFMVKKGGRIKMRPELETHENVDVSGSLLALVRDCWEEGPKQRPDIHTVRNLLKNMNNQRTDNLMDHVFNVLEEHANILEQEVEERMKELVEEKKKSDILLYRMLPKQVADKLKMGQSVQPESFDMVTVFFSDVVSFTTLAGKCTPMQVVTLLNELYTIFDNIIDDNDVYKVETIGDGYLCVSGLPHRNGTEHIRNVCRMSIELLFAIKSFRIPHLPMERVNIRIGIHSGPCVTGVVGQTMPRYCLFGDTVNTASRMESNGKAAHIHLSSEANDLLLKYYPEFKTESRGEVIIKGKGVMQTFWLQFDEEPAPHNQIGNNDPMYKDWKKKL